ncbi:MAG: DUF4825 domain-containing protein [Defluviitaleaceae bacterium]|nr:DUF4825 domain-containing protein [Defluviitaleaceae bacterium]
MEDFKKTLIRIGAGLAALLILVFAIYIVIYRPAPQGSGDVSEQGMSELWIPYVGAAHLTQRVVDSLPLPGDNWVARYIQIGADYSIGGFDVYPPHTLRVFYEPQYGSIIEGTREYPSIPIVAFESNAEMLFGLIGNLEEVTFSVRFTPSEGNVLDADFFDYRWSMALHGDTLLKIAGVDEVECFADMAMRHAGSLTGPIVILGGTLYLDPVEVVFSTDYARIAELWQDWQWSIYDLMPNGYYIRHLNVELVSPFDYGRIEELGLDLETDFADYWPYEHRLDAETLSFEITDETVFIFVDYALALDDTAQDGSRLAATGAEDFLAARGSEYGLTDASRVGASTFRRIVYFVQVEDGQVVSVTEEFLFTQ